ncbi:MAG: PTS sugar transporter subunit IIA, partial [Eubacterium sp.]
MFGKPYKRILLVCGHGYGTTTMLREALLGEYQVHIVDTIPLYKVAEYPGWNGVDCVLSTARIDSQLPKPTIIVNPILNQKDYNAIETIGISRKHNLISYYAIEQNLSFLKSEDKKRVMNVIEKELGYRTVSQYKTPKEFSSLLKYDCIQIIDQKMDWVEAVHIASHPLIERGFIENAYVDDMITTMESIGFYAISDGSFALLHGKEKVGVNKTSISLVINRQPVTFGDKKVKIIFCLAPENAKAHIPAIITLMRMVKKTPIIQALENAKSIEEIYETILRYEFEVA